MAHRTRRLGIDRRSIVADPALARRALEDTAKVARSTLNVCVRAIQVVSVEEVVISFRRKNPVSKHEQRDACQKT